MTTYKATYLDGTTIKTMTVTALDYTKAYLSVMFEIPLDNIIIELEKVND